MQSHITIVPCPAENKTLHKCQAALQKSLGVQIQNLCCLPSPTEASGLNPVPLSQVSSKKTAGALRWKGAPAAWGSPAPSLGTPLKSACSHSLAPVLPAPRHPPSPANSPAPPAAFLTLPTQLLCTPRAPLQAGSPSVRGRRGSCTRLWPCQETPALTGPLLEPLLKALRAARRGEQRGSSKTEPLHVCEEPRG